MSRRLCQSVPKVLPKWLAVLVLVLSLALGSMKAQAGRMQRRPFNLIQPAAFPYTADQHALYLPIFYGSPGLALSDFVEYQSSQYSYAAIGEVLNFTHYQYSVTLEALLSDPYSNTITQTAVTLFPVTLPGQSNPFVVDHDPDYTTKAVSIEDAVLVTSPVYTTVSVTSKQYFCGDVFPYGIMEGTIRNENPYPVNDLLGYVWAVQDNPSWAGLTIDKKSLQPEEEASFQSSLFPAFCYVSIDVFRVVVQGTVNP
jgi:hypothetical protein